MPVQEFIVVGLREESLRSTLGAGRLFDEGRQVIGAEAQLSCRGQLTADSGSTQSGLRADHARE